MRRKEELDPSFLSPGFSWDISSHLIALGMGFKPLVLWVLKPWTALHHWLA
jgi:hypothetical protein